MGDLQVPSSLPLKCIGKGRLGLSPGSLTSTSPKAVSLPSTVGEVSVEATVSPWRGPPGPEPGKLIGCGQSRHSRPYQKSLPGQGSKACSSHTMATQLSQKVKAVLARLQKFLTYGPLAGRVQRTMSRPCPHWTGCQAASKTSRHSAVVPHQCLEHQLQA